MVSIANKWYLHNPASVLENDTDNLLWNFEIAVYHKQFN